MIKVGIVEDNKTLREGFETLLNRTPGFQCVCTCSTVADALKNSLGVFIHSNDDDVNLGQQLLELRSTFHAR